MAPANFQKIYALKRRSSKENSVIRLKSNILSTQIFGMATPLQLGNSCTE